MSLTSVPEKDQPLDAFDPVIDLRSRDTVGWEVPSGRDGATATDSIGVALMSRRDDLRGRFVGVRLSARAAAEVARLLHGAARLDGLALILAGPLDRAGLRVLQRARQRGALVGCDTTAALVHFAALRPDLLCLPAARLAAPSSDATAAAVVRVLVALADTIAAKVLVDDVTSIRQADALRDLGVALAQGEPFGRSALSPPATRSNVTFAPFGRAKRSSTATLEELRPSIPATSSVAALVELCLEHVDHDWVVLVDRRSHPVRLVERAALLLGEPFERHAVCVDPSASLRRVADVALDRPKGERSQPLVVCDFAGRYRGLLVIERPPTALAA